MPAFSMAILMIFLVLAGSSTRSGTHWSFLAGSVPLAMFGALIFTVLKMPTPIFRTGPAVGPPP